MAEAPAPTPTPAVPKSPTSEFRPLTSTQGSLLAGSISISQMTPVKPEAPKVQVEVKALTQEDLERYWHETAEELGLVELMSNADVHLGDHAGRIEINARTTWFHEDFKPHKIDVMELLRKKSAMPMLDAKVTPLFVEEDEVIYSPTDKYNAMLEHNPHLLELRKLFPQIDY